MHTYLDLCNLHLRPSTMEVLARAAVSPTLVIPAYSPMTIAPYPCGLFFTVPRRDVDAADLPEDLVRLLAFAQDARATLVRVHPNGAQGANLPTYDDDWDTPNLDIGWTVILPRDVAEDAAGLLSTFERDPEQPDVPAHLTILRAALRNVQ